MGRTAGKIALIGGGGLRTPLVAFGIHDAAQRLGAEEFVLYDQDRDRTQLMAALSRAIVAREGGTLRIRCAAGLEDAVADAGFVLHSIRTGGMAARAADESVAIANGYPGQETTGPAGVAMGLRTVAVAVDHALLVERSAAPGAWMVNFSNPAGLVTQAISQQSGVQVVGICDTPSEMVHRIQLGLDAAADRVRCDYVGLNHLGWIRRIELDGRDVTQSCLADDAFLRRLYSADLFDPEMIRQIGLIPTEYLYFYYARRQALQNQQAAGTTRGAEVGTMNAALLSRLAGLVAAGDTAAAVVHYTHYINSRSASYMKLEGEGGSALSGQAMEDVDPFRAASGYHRIALDVMCALCGDDPRRLIVNTRNGGAVRTIAPDDVIEASCNIVDGTIVPDPVGELPEEVAGLVLAVKAYERAALQAGSSGDVHRARKAMLLHPAIGEWRPSERLLAELTWRGDHVHCHC